MLVLQIKNPSFDSDMVVLKANFANYWLILCMYNSIFVHTPNHCINITNVLM